MQEIIKRIKTIYGINEASSYKIVRLSEEDNVDKTSITTGKEAKWMSHGDLVLQDVLLGHEENWIQILKNNLTFGIIDIDDFDACKIKQSLVIDIAGKLQAIGLPIRHYYSKSGNSHIYIYFKKTYDINQVKTITRYLSQIFGLNYLKKEDGKESFEILPKNKKQIQFLLPFLNMTEKDISAELDIIDSFKPISYENLLDKILNIPMMYMCKEFLRELYSIGEGGRYNFIIEKNFISKAIYAYKCIKRKYSEGTISNILNTMYMMFSEPYEDKNEIESIEKQAVVIIAKGEYNKYYQKCYCEDSTCMPIKDTKLKEVEKEEKEKNDVDRAINMLNKLGIVALQKIRETGGYCFVNEDGEDVVQYIYYYNDLFVKGKNNKLEAFETCVFQLFENLQKGIDYTDEDLVFMSTRFKTIQINVFAKMVPNAGTAFAELKKQEYNFDFQSVGNSLLDLISRVYDVIDIFAKEQGKFERDSFLYKEVEFLYDEEKEILIYPNLKDKELDYKEVKKNVIILNKTYVANEFVGSNSSALQVGDFYKEIREIFFTPKYCCFTPQTNKFSKNVKCRFICIDMEGFNNFLLDKGIGVDSIRIILEKIEKYNLNSIQEDKNNLDYVETEEKKEDEYVEEHIETEEKKEDEHIF